MFAEIIAEIEDNKFSHAIALLEPLLADDDKKIVASANYLLGYVYSCRENKEKSEHRAQRYLLDNINSEYPVPHAYVLYADLVEDKNVAINYLRKGIHQYPKDAHIYRSLLRFSTDKNSVIDEIKESGLTDMELLGNVIECLIKMGKWGQISRFIFRIQNNEKISDYARNYLDLLKAYALLFDKTANYAEANRILQDVIEKDIDNDLAYSPYLGLIFSLINVEQMDEAKRYFDKIPLSNVIHDLDDGPWSIIFVDFSREYKIIFDTIANAFSKDKERKNKARALYALYLYYPSEIYEIYRYQKSNIKALENVLKADFNKYVATALFNMHCHYKQFSEANQVFMSFLTHYENPEDYYVDYTNITDAVTCEVLMVIVGEIIALINDAKDFDTNRFALSGFNAIVERLYKDGNYPLIEQLADCLSDSDILNSNCAFECAYAYGESGNDRARRIYERIIKKEPNNSSALNNLGVIYEHQDDLKDAYDAFSKANKVSPDEELYKRNMNRVEKKIAEKKDELKAQKQDEIKYIAKNVSLDYFEEIGYTDGLREKLSLVNDVELRSVLLRDLHECAISIATGQDKSATIMCGSIIEALLMFKIIGTGQKTYDISSISNGKRASNFPIADMGLNELLYVADKEELICKSNFHLSHYARDYRNIVHPAKEIRTGQSVTHENAMMMWTILKQIMRELLA